MAAVKEKARKEKARLRREWVNKYEGDHDPHLQQQLRVDPKLDSILELWWKTAAASAKRHFVTHAEYVTVSRKMYKALYA